MSLFSNLERRGAVYYWRRRLPSILAKFLGCTHLKMSLQTKEPRQARYLGAHMDAAAANLFGSLNMKTITASQLNQIFRTVFEEHRSKQHLAFDIDRRNGCGDLEGTIAGDRIAGHAYGVLARKGVGAQLTDRERDELVGKGLSLVEANAVDLLLNHKRVNNERPSLSRIYRLLDEVGAETSGANVATAQPYYLQALGDALLAASETYGQPELPVVPYEHSLILTEAETEADAIRNAEDQRQASDMRKVGPFTEFERSIEDIPSIPDGTSEFVTFGEKLMAERLKAKRWDDKAGRQAAFIYALFSKFMIERFKVQTFARLEQKQLYEFTAFLGILPKSFGKSQRHADMTIVKIETWSKSLPSEKTGSAPATMNRHLTFLGQLLKYAKGAGIKFDPDLSFSPFRAAKKGRARDDRAIPKAISFETFFALPVFTGCLDWGRKLHLPGEHIFHRAAYYGPIIGFYSGMRREEYSGFAIEDLIIDDGDHPYFYVADNAFRRIKNPQSKRHVAVHPELIRLGLLDYRKELKRLGHGRLFPDLYSGIPKRSLGDRLYDELLPGLRFAGFTPHHLRHFFNSSLKQKKVSAEMRADMMGHAGKTETTERYADAYDIKVQLKDLQKMPIITANLKARPIQLLPWVEWKEQAPWSHAVRRNKVADMRLTDD